MPYTIYRGALLTPDEMEALTESWKPYRSIGACRQERDRGCADTSFC